MRQSKFPTGWDLERVKKVLAHYKSQSEKEAVAEDEAAFEVPGQTVIVGDIFIIPYISIGIVK